MQVLFLLLVPQQSRTKKMVKLSLVFVLFCTIYKADGSIRVCKTYPDFYIPFNKNCWEYDYDNANFTDIVDSWKNFTTETYTLTLDDGYKISVFRTYSKVSKSTPIILGHSSVSNANNWVISGNNSLAYVLGNLGYDVWIISVRGTIYSKEHVTLSNKDRKYWNFTFHEIGIYDLKHTTDLVLNKTGKKAIYIGFSMGSTISYVYCSINPTDCKNTLQGIISLGPVGYLLDVKGLYQLLWQPFVWPVVRELIFVLFNGEYFKFIPPLKVLYKILSKYPLGNYIALTAFSLLFGFDYEQIDSRSFPIILNKFQDTIGIEVFTHYFQVANSKSFSQFDFGTTQNLKFYNQPKPPQYPLENIPVPVAMFVGKNDFLATPEGTNKTYSRLNEDVQCGYQFIDYPLYCHYDWFIARDNPQLLYNDLIKKIDNFANNICE